MKRISKFIEDLEYNKSKYYTEYCKKNKRRFENDDIIISKILKYNRDKDDFPSLRLEQVFTEIFLRNILENNGYYNEVDFTNPKNNKDVDFYIRLSTKDELLLEIYSPNESKWFPYEKNSRKPINKNSQPVNVKVQLYSPPQVQFYSPLFLS